MNERVSKCIPQNNLFRSMRTCGLMLSITLSSIGLLWLPESTSAQDEVLSTEKSEEKSSWNPRFHKNVVEDEFMRSGAAFAWTADGRIVRFSAKTTSISSDAGKTWSASRHVPMGEHTGSAAKLAVTPNGTFVLAYMNSGENVWEWDAERKEVSEASTLPVYAMRSTDEGVSWSDPEKIFAGRSGALTDILAGSSGSVILPITGYRRNPTRLVQYVMVTRDEGASWSERVIDIGGHGHHEGAMEPTLVELKDRRVWMLIRTNHDVLYESFSNDGGRNWTEAKATDISSSSSPPMLRRLSSGRLMLIWNQARPLGVSEEEWRSKPLARRGGQFGTIPASWHREEVSLAFSEDEGRTWSPPAIIAHQRNGWLSYPRVFEPRPGEIKLGLFFNYEIMEGPKAVPRGAIFLAFREQEFLPPSRTP